MIKWDDINADLLGDEATKPADIDTNPNTGDEGIVSEEKDEPIKTPSDDDKPDNEDDESTVDNSDKDPSDDDIEDKDDDEKEKLTPFHEHPDWKKSQEEKNELKETVAKLQGQIETLTALSTNKTEKVEAAQKSAKERLQEKIDSGWEPKSQQDMIEVYGEMIKEDLKNDLKKEKEEEKELNKKAQDSQMELSKQVEAAYLETGITDQAEKAKIANQVVEWSKQGMNISPATIKIAAEQLKLKGEIGVQKPIEKSEAQKKTDESRDDINKKVNRGKSKSGKSAQDSSKPTYDYIKKHSMEDIIEQVGKSLG